MSCSNPSLAVDYGLKENGKRYIKFLPRRLDFDYQYYKDKYGDDLLVLPCGQCEGCILARRKMWSLRCYAESLYHQKNCFITLTYNDENCPSQLKRRIFKILLRHFVIQVLKSVILAVANMAARLHALTII